MSFRSKAANRICAKRLVPFLPTLVESLEHHGHLHLSPEVRTQLLALSSAVAELSASNCVPIERCRGLAR